MDIGWVHYRLATMGTPPLSLFKTIICHLLHMRGSIWLSTEVLSWESLMGGIRWWLGLELPEGSTGLAVQAGPRSWLAADTDRQLDTRLGLPRAYGDMASPRGLASSVVLRGSEPRRGVPWHPGGAAGFLCHTWRYRDITFAT